MRTMKRFLVVVALTLAAVTSASAAVDPELERFRAELIEYVEAISTLPAGLLGEVFEGQPSFAEIEAQILAMPEDELRTMHAGLSELPYWRQLPQMLVMAGQPVGAPSPAQLESLMAGRADLGRLRDDTLRLLDGLRSLVAGAPDNEAYNRRIDALEVQIRELSVEELITLRKAMAEEVPVWRRTLQRAASGEPLGAEVALKVESHCGTAFPGGVLCEIGHIVDEIAAIPGYIVAFAESAFNGILDIFNTVVDALPTDPEQILQAMGLNDPSWFENVLGSVPILSPSCPTGDLPGLGTVGTIEAEYRCKRGLEWISGAIYDNVPDDIWGMPLKVPAAVIYYPINYLCLCMESGARIAFDDAQLAHRALVAQMLDLTVSSRSTQTSVDLAQASTTDLDGDVAVVEAKLDVIEGKTDTLIEGSGAQGLFLQDFEALALRMRIEADLVREGNHRVSLFQLPTVVGGYLDVVRAVVDETIVTAAAAGVDTAQAARALETGDFAFGDGFFKEAYDHYRDAYQITMRALR